MRHRWRDTAQGESCRRCLIVRVKDARTRKTTYYLSSALDRVIDTRTHLVPPCWLHDWRLDTCDPPTYTCKTCGVETDDFTVTEAACLGKDGARRLLKDRLLSAARDEVVRAAQAYAKATASFRDVFEERMRLFDAVAALARLEKP